MSNRNFESKERLLRADGTWNVFAALKRADGTWNVPATLGAVGLVLGMVCSLLGQESPWEFDPYRMRVWVSIDPALSLPIGAEERLRHQVEQQMDLLFGAAADADARSTPRNLYSSVMREIDKFTIRGVLDNEMVLVVGRNHPESKEIQTLETVLQKAESIYLSLTNLNEIARDIATYRDDPLWGKFADKLQSTSGASTEFLKQLKEGQLLAAMVRRSELASLGRSVRYIPARFPWQLESLLRTHDKIFAVSISVPRDEQFRIQLREIDCSMRVIGPLIETSTPTWESIPRSIAFAAEKAFAPLARIEEADVRTAQLRIRSGGLITDPNHPALLVPGDVLQPYVRRDDRNGVPTLLQSIPWTYVAITEGDNINARSAIYTGIRSPLAGRKNKRTRKICLRVRPVAQQTELQMSVLRDPTVRVPGAEVYRRTPGGEDLTFVSRADWRGITRLTETNLPVAFYDPVEPKTNVKPTATRPDSNDKPLKATIALRAPLYLYYVKHGGTLLARLPIVTGQATFEIAELPDDRRRLEAEAFVKGVQSDMLDLVARRQILSTRLRQRIEEKNAIEAQALLKELQAEKSYDKMLTSLDAVQRRILSSDRGPIPTVSQKRIDQMFDLTRQMLQRYLQDNLLRDMEIAVGKLSRYR